MSTAATTREAVRAHPFLLTALRTGVLNYRAAARYLDIDDVDAGAAALRRFAEELPPYEVSDPELRIRVQSGIGESSCENPVLAVGDTLIGADGGEATAVIASGTMTPAVAARILARIDESGIEPIAVGFDHEVLVIAVQSTASPTVIRCIEGT